jgi:hypothetical protein
VRKEAQTLIDEDNAIEARNKPDYIPRFGTIPPFQIAVGAPKYKGYGTKALVIRGEQKHAQMLKEILANHYVSERIGGRFIPYGMKDKADEIYSESMCAQNAFEEDIAVYDLPVEIMEDEAIGKFDLGLHSLHQHLVDGILDEEGNFLFVAVEKTTSSETRGKYIFVFKKKDKKKALEFIDNGGLQAAFQRSIPQSMTQKYQGRAGPKRNTTFTQHRFQPDSSHIRTHKNDKGQVYDLKGFISVKNAKPRTAAWGKILPPALFENNEAEFPALPKTWAGGTSASDRRKMTNARQEFTHQTNHSKAITTAAKAPIEDNTTFKAALDEHYEIMKKAAAENQKQNDELQAQIHILNTRVSQVAQPDDLLMTRSEIMENLEKTVQIIEQNFETRLLVLTEGILEELGERLETKLEETYKKVQKGANNRATTKEDMAAEYKKLSNDLQKSIGKTMRELSAVQFGQLRTEMEKRIDAYCRSHSSAPSEQSPEWKRQRMASNEGTPARKIPSNRNQTNPADNPMEAETEENEVASPPHTSRGQHLHQPIFGGDTRA